MNQNKSFRLLRLLVLLPFLLNPTSLQAHEGQAVLAGEATVYEDQADENGGGDSQVCVGNEATTATRRAFVRYTLPEIEAGSTIYRVVWSVFQDQVHSQGGGPLAATLQVRRVTAGWVEGTGGGGVEGPCAGGDVVAGVDWTSQPAVAATDSATAPLLADNEVNYVIDSANGNEGLIGDVQAWLDIGASNFGWRLALEEEGTADNARALVPGTLVIYWNIPPEQIVFADGFE
jgi:hypothetical protein